MACSSSEACDTAWRICTGVLLQKEGRTSKRDYSESIATLQQAGLTRALGLWAVETFENYVSMTVSGTLKDALKRDQQADAVVTAIAAAHAKFVEAKRSVASLEDIPECEWCTAHFLIQSSAIVEELASEDFSNSVYRVLKDLLERCESGQESIDTQRALCSQLVELGFSRVVEEAVSWVVFERIDALVIKRTRGNFESRALPGLLDWVNQFLDGWITSVLPPPAHYEDLLFDDVDEGPQMSIDAHPRDRQLKRWRKRISFYLHEAVCGVRTRQLLKLIETFPKSLSAVEDLKDCILSTDEKPVVTRLLREQFKKKILNAGTLTSDILQQYVNMIRTLRVLDPTGVILENVSDPVREYLRRRPDTVRCIVSEMTGDGDLYEELERGRPRRAKDIDGDVDMDSADGILVRRIRDDEDEDCLSIDGDFDVDGKVDFELYDNWEPDPIDAPYRDGKWNPGGDAIATLVTIYGSSEQIVNEYKGLLADKLVGNFDLDVKRETRILQLLTERFGKDAMHDCSIMLKDVEDSRATLTEAQGKSDSDELLRGFEATVISREFWPKLVDEAEFNVPDRLERQMSLYSDTFKELKDPRKLRWQHGLGVVSVSLEFEDGRRIDASLTPLLATILMHFAENSRQDIRELQKKMGVEDETMFRRKVQTLANQGFIRATDASNMTYETVEQGGDVDGTGAENDVGAEDDAVVHDDGDMGDGKGEEAEMTVYETFIMAMLQNLKQLPLEKIHTMLKRFVQTPGYDKSQEQLASFLGLLVEDGKIEVSAGMYRIKK